MNKVSVIGIDIGDFSVKTSENITFRSLITQNDLKEEGNCITIDKDKFYIGKGQPFTDFIKFRNKSFIPIFYSAIAESTSCNDVVIGLGLPISYYHSCKDELINIILSNNNKKINYNGSERIINIIDVDVFPESALIAPDGFSGVILDIGSSTCDFCLIESINNETKIKEYSSVTKGIGNAKVEFIDSVNKTFGLNLTADDSDRILHHGLYINGIKKDISFNMAVFDEFVDDVIYEVSKKISALNTHRILITGGGGYTLFNRFKDKFGDACILDSNYMFSNAKSFKEMLEEDY